jgi:hypothetical protein
MYLDSCNVVGDRVQIGCFKIEEGTCSQSVNDTEVCVLDVKNVTLTEVYLLSLR